MKVIGYRHRLTAAVVLLSVALIAYQVAVIQLLSYVQWYHYANMVISIALLGFGAAGTLLSLKRTWLIQNSDFLLPVLIISSGLMMAASVELGNTNFAQFDSYLLFTNRTQWLKLLANSLLYFIPFFLGALAIGIVFTKYVNEIGKLYFANLVGSGLGALLAAVAAWYFFPSSLPQVMALMAILAGLFLLSESRHWVIAVLFVTSIVFIGFRIVKPGHIELSQYKSLSKTMNLPGAGINIQRPGPYGLVQLVSADAIRYAPGLSLAFDKEVPVRTVLFNNGDWYGPVDSWKATDSFHLLDYTTMNLPYVLNERKKVLVLNSGSGLNVSHALAQEAVQIEAIEPHPAVYKFLRKQLAHSIDSLTYQRRVNIINLEPRSFLSATNKKYNLVLLPMTGSFGGGVGLYAMREEYVLTKEAFLKMWNLLEDDGVICITSYTDYPFRNVLKLTATFAEVLNELGINDTQNHVAAIRSWATISFILKKTPLTETDCERIRQFCDQLSFDPLFLPGLKNEERSAYNAISDSTLFVYADILLNGDREKLYRDYGFHIRPATDDKPYFSQFLRRKSLPQLAKIFGSQSVSFLELGWLIAAVTFLQISVLAILLIVLPLFRIGFRGGHKSWTLLYFSGLGAGYMLLEIVLIQKFILFFGNPVYSASFVIAVLMLASGAGSYYSTRKIPERKIMQRILLIIAVILLLYTFFLSPVLNAVSGFPDLLKYAISLPLVAVPAFFMGMPFPLGLRLLAARSESTVPWAWGVNGCVSVISASLAAMLAVEVGFSTVVMLAGIFYLVSAVAMRMVNS